MVKRGQTVSEDPYRYEQKFDLPFYLYAGVVLYTLYSIHCIIYIVFYTVYSIQCILYSVFYTVYSIQCILYIV
jgi:hypothetical protein